METISSTDAKQHFGAFLDEGSRKILIVKRRNRAIGAFIPMSDLEKLRKIKAQELAAAAKALAKEGAANGLTDEQLNAILKEINPS